MNVFLPSAQKYRPNSFSQVLGQNAITNTLKNALINKQIHNAYLFSGPRGSGKTTCARIFAKAVNCLNTLDGEACNKCDICTLSNNQRSFNIIELDAASNNSIQDIRNIISQAPYPPPYGNYKVYIIDEAHMLSQQALNAFLKILEEPPKHVVFILATTERQKIISTIVSRCQTFNFSRLSNDAIGKQIKIIARNENILIDDKSIDIIARKSDGALRDALMTFDQISLSLNKKIDYKSVITRLNIIDDLYFTSIVNYLIHHDLSSIIQIYSQIIEQGSNPEDIIIGVVNYIRNLLIAKASDTQSANFYSYNDFNKHKNIINEDLLIETLSLSSNALHSLAKSKNIRLHTEIYLLNLYKLYKQSTSISDKDFNTTSGSPQIKQLDDPIPTNYPQEQGLDPNINQNVEKQPTSTACEYSITLDDISPESILEQLKKHFKDNPQLQSILNNISIKVKNTTIDIVSKYNVDKYQEAIKQYLKETFKFESVKITKSTQSEYSTAQTQPIFYNERDKIEYFEQKYSNRKDNLSKFISEFKLKPSKA